MPELPSGIVTFLFTDIEGSTRMWEEHPEAMRVALARHDELASSVIEKFAGTLVKSRGEGDSLFAVFALATDAVAAASALQQAYTFESWPDSLLLKVRMALHTGESGLRDGDYYGASVNRCARLRAIGHGGQVLLSDVSHDLCRDSLPVECTLRPLGEHRLKDLGRPESVFQLCHPRVQVDFPPLRSLDSLPNNLPQQVTSFIGREKEVAEVKALLEKSRLVTLTGSGGSGKTRLALQAAAEMLDGSGDGVWLVELAALTDPSLVPQTVASVLGLREETGKSLTLTLTQYLKSKFLLLVLDNCEHLLNACAQLSDAILRQCPKVLILATSREGLGIGGELTYRVPSLSLPDPKRDITPESLTQFESVALFIERAQFQNPQFTVTNANAPALASVCYRLDGIPLAIELAAARVRSLSVEEVNQRLDQRFRLLTGGSRTALPRQQTLRSMVDWSYDLLNDAEQALLRRLSVFAGGWTLGAAEQVCAGEPVEEWEVLDLLTSLVDKSLVVAEQRDGVTRYRLSETVRQYARDRLEEADEGGEARTRHLAHFLALAEEAEPELRGQDPAVWLDRLETEHDNVRAALEVSGLKSQVSTDSSLRLCGAVWRFWYVRGYFGEGRVWCRSALEQAMSGDRLPARAKALTGAGWLAFEQSDYDSARSLHEESLTIWRELGDRQGIAASLNNLGNVALEQSDYTSARSLHEESLSIRRESGDRRGIAASLNNLGNVALEHGGYASARSLYEESLTIWRELGDRRSIATSLNNLGIVALEQGDYASTRALHEESLSTRRELGDRPGIAESLEAFAGMAVAQSEPIRAVRLLGAVECLREEIGKPIRPTERKSHDREVTAARKALADADFECAWAEGRAMTLEQAIEYALEEPCA